MAIQKQLWVSDISGNLYKNIGWLEKAVNDDAYVENKTVSLPQSGAKPNVVMDRATVPATITQRTDTVEEYNLHEFTSDPTLIRDIEEVEVSYDKRSDVLADHDMTLRERLADYAAYVWGNGVTTVTTSGASREAGGSLTGARLSTTKKDVVKLAVQLTRNKVPVAGRFLVMDADTWADVMNDPTLTSRDYTEDINIETGSIGRLLGFETYVTEELGFYGVGTNVAIAPGATIPVTAERFCLAYNPLFVRRAKGAIKVFENIDDATMFGSVFSSLVRFGVAHRWTDKRGVVALKQVTV